MQKLSMDALNRKSVAEVKRAEKTPVIAVWENVRSAYNVGSLFRTGDAFLLEAIYICGYTAQPPRKEIDKTALGATDTVSWKYFPTSAEAIADLRQKSYKVFAIEQADKSSALQKLENVENAGQALIFGNEISGVEQSTILQCDGCIEIPQLGMKHSLNISVAAGIVLWETVRKRIKNEEL